MKYILALDQGTTSSRAIIFDRRGRIKSKAQKEFRQYYPKPGWVEHDAGEIWSSQSSVAVEAIARAGLTSADIAAIGITNQRETVVIWDRQTGEPIHRAIVWQDRRTRALCETLIRKRKTEWLRKRTGLIPDPYFSATKVRWLLDHVKGAQKKAKEGRLAFGTVDSWLIWKLTGGKVHVTDAGNASRTLLFNIHTGDWDRDCLRLFDIPHAILPEVRSSSEVYGEAHGRSFLAGIPVAGVAGDQHAALFGQGCFSIGMAKNTYGTGCFLLMQTGMKPVSSKYNLLTTVAWKVGGKTAYALEGSIFIAGAAIQWLRDGLEVIDSAPEVNRLAATVEDTDGVYIVPAFAGLGAPHWDPGARGTIVGITRGTHRGHLARATLESIAYQSYDVLKAMEKDVGRRLKELRVDGGACASDLLMQFQADLLRVPVVRPAITETTALGAAYLAGLAVGYWPDRRTIAEQWREEKRFRPDRNAALMKEKHAHWQRAVKRAQGWETT